MENERKLVSHCSCGPPTSVGCTWPACKNGLQKAWPFDSQKAPVAKSAEARIAELEEKNRRLSVNAERYLWLRDDADLAPGDSPLVFLANELGFPVDSRADVVLIGEDLDRAVDKARGKLNDQT